MQCFEDGYRLEEEEYGLYLKKRTPAAGGVGGGRAAIIARVSRILCKQCRTELEPGCEERRQE